MHVNAIYMGVIVVVVPVNGVYMDVNGVYIDVNGVVWCVNVAVCNINGAKRGIYAGAQASALILLSNSD